MRKAFNAHGAADAFIVVVEIGPWLIALEAEDNCLLKHNLTPDDADVTDHELEINESESV